MSSVGCLILDQRIRQSFALMNELLYRTKNLSRYNDINEANLRILQLNTYSISNSASCRNSNEASYLDE